MNKEELNKEYNGKVKLKFLESKINSNANNENTKVIDCFINEKDKEGTTYYCEPTKQLQDSICDAILKIKDKNIKVLLLRLHTPFNKAEEVYNNMDIRKRYINEHKAHSINVYLFDNIESDFYSLI
ncbi:MAG: hypothetical protein WBF48_14015 [Halarcobacter sp.]